MGGRANWLDEATLPSYVWSYSTRYYEPDHMLGERTPCFKAEVHIDILNRRSVGEDGRDVSLKQSLCRPRSALDRDKDTYGMW